MKEYVLMLIGSALICSLISMMAPEGKLQRYVALAGGLCILCVSASPIYSFISLLSEADARELDEIIFGEYSAGEDEVFLEVYEQGLMQAGAENAASALRSMLCRDMSVPYEDIEVYVELYMTEERFEAKKVSVVLYRSAVLCDPREICGYVSSLLACECEIVYG